MCKALNEEYPDESAYVGGEGNIPISYNLYIIYYNFPVSCPLLNCQPLYIVVRIRKTTYNTDNAHKIYIVIKEKIIKWTQCWVKMQRLKKFVEMQTYFFPFI